MPRLPPPKVLILARNAGVGQHWAGMLADSAADLWQAPGEVPPDRQVEVLVTDLESADAVRAAGGPTVCPDAGSDPADGVAVVGIGACDWGDLRLREDCTPDELALACTLLGEVTRLRRERARAAEVQQTISQLAYSDPLTGLPNRRAWDMQLASKLGPARIDGTTAWLAIVDLDGFKQVNDACGLSVGDDLLRRVAQALAGALRRDDAIARLGGDEFGVLLVGIDEPSARRVFDRLRAAVANEALPGESKRLTASIGYASSETDGASAADLFVAAERALRQAKSSGGNQARQVSPRSMTEGASAQG